VLAALRRHLKNRVELARATGTEIRGHHVHRTVIARPTQCAHQHGRVVHEAFAVALAGVLGQHLAKGFPLALVPHAQHLLVEFFEEGAPDFVSKLRGQTVLRKTV